MDILDNVMFATFFRQLTGGRAIESDYIPNPATFPLPVLANNTSGFFVPVYNYTAVNKLAYCTVEDVHFIEAGILRHWYDVMEKAIYAGPASQGSPQYSNFVYSSTYHLMYAYLIENTRILQIFERVIEKYLHDEELGISDSADTFSWIQNSERLFFKSDIPKQTNLRSVLRPNSDSSRRNAYYRMFGMDLAFGDIDPQNPAKPYFKARVSNQQFIVLFERYLSEIWQGFINASNTSGPNTSDVNILVELAQELREILIARRGKATNPYSRLNLSKEEYSSVLMNSWFAFVVSYDSPIVTYLNAQSSTAGERLAKIGTKVGIQAHSKCQALFDMAGAAAIVLLAIEADGLLNDSTWVQGMLKSLKNPPANPLQATQRSFMDNFLTVINNWEKATGHRIKNPEANIRGTVKISSNGVPAAAKPRPALN